MGARFKKDSPGMIVRKERMKKKLSQKKLAEMVPMSQSALHKFETGDTISTTKTVRIAKALGIDPNLLDYLETEDNQDRISSCKIPVLNWDECDTWVSTQKIMEREEREFISFPLLSEDANKNLYALRINGFSMVSSHEESFLPGNIIIVDPQRKEKSGDFIIYKSSPHNARIKFRKIVMEEELYMVASNCSYGATEVASKDWRSLGVVVSKISLMN